MPKMIQQGTLITFECPNCGYIQRAIKDANMKCPKCTPDFKGWFQENKITIPIDTEAKE